MNEKEIIDNIVKEVSKRLGVIKTEEKDKRTTDKKLVPIGISNRHLHLSEEHLKYLMSEDYKLEVLRELSQPGQFASKLTVTLIGSQGFIQNVRVLGPCRGRTQVEISKTDSFILGIKPPIRLSGDIAGSCGCIIYVNDKTIKLDEGVIIAARHLHLSLLESEAFGLKNGDIVNARVCGKRGVLFENIVVRAGDGHKMELHLDTDEANAADVNNGDLVEII
ncbi:MAG: phosphate propanoyltransferase [Candidatus Hydrogenedentota bacterium]